MSRDDNNRHDYPSAYAQPGRERTAERTPEENSRPRRRESVRVIYEDDTDESERTYGQARRREDTRKPTAEPEAAPTAETDDGSEENGEKGKKKRKKKHRAARAFRAILLILLLLAGAFYLLCFSLTVKTEYRAREAIAEEESYGLEKKFSKGVTNILLIGTDARVVGEDSRSDAMIVVSICPLQRRIYMTSILRDSYVDIPGYGKNRINHAYQMGGAPLLIQTIEQNLGIRIDGYSKVDFYSFVEVIDALGGVEMEITAEEVHYVDAYLSEINQLMGIEAQDSFIWEGGTYNLNGRQALAYGRIRYIGTDFGRTERQRKIIAAALNKVVKTSPLQLYKAAGIIMENIVTDIPSAKLALLIMRVPLLAGYDMSSDQIPYDGLWWNDTMPNGQEVLGMDMGATRNRFRTLIYGSKN